jgi:hypothetical protein
MKWIKTLIFSFGAILLAAALERFIVAAGDAPALKLADPLLGIPLRYAVLIVGGFELLVAFICLFGEKTGPQLGWVAWLTLDYVLIQAGLILMDCHSQGACIGALTDPLCLGRGTSGFIITLLPVYLLTGSWGGIVWLWLLERKAKAAAYLKMPCPACGTHIRFNDSDLGRQLPCTHCMATVTLRKPSDYLKMPCFFCKGHIEFPAHAIGQKLKCPHCRMDITLQEPS